MHCVVAEPVAPDPVPARRAGEGRGDAERLLVLEAEAGGGCGGLRALGAAHRLPPGATAGVHRALPSSPHRRAGGRRRPAPYDYIEVLQVTDIDEYRSALSRHPAIQPIIAEIGQFVDRRRERLGGTLSRPWERSREWPESDGRVGPSASHLEPSGGEMKARSKNVGALSLIVDDSHGPRCLSARRGAHRRAGDSTAGRRGADDRAGAAPVGCGEEGTIVIAYDGDIDHIEPMEFRSIAAYDATANLYEPLIQQELVDQGDNVFIGSETFVGAGRRELRGLRRWNGLHLPPAPGRQVRRRHARSPPTTTTTRSSAPWKDPGYITLLTGFMAVTSIDQVDVVDDYTLTITASPARGAGGDRPQLPGGGRDEPGHGRRPTPPPTIRGRRTTSAPTRTPAGRTSSPAGIRGSSTSSSPTPTTGAAPTTSTTAR